jgi:hypothetical protein
MSPSRSSPHIIDVDHNLCSSGSNDSGKTFDGKDDAPILDDHMIDSDASKWPELEEPYSLWHQILEIVDWDSESKRLADLTIPYTIQGCTQGLFQTINVAIIGHSLGVMEANAYVVVATLLEFSQTITYGFGEGKNQAMGSPQDKITLLTIQFFLSHLPSSRWYNSPSCRGRG